MAERKQYLLRISPSLWKDLERWAADEFRSVNGQIEFLLQRAVDERRRGDRPGSTGTGRQEAPGMGSVTADESEGEGQEKADLREFID